MSRFVRPVVQLNVQYTSYSAALVNRAVVLGRDGIGAR